MSDWQARAACRAEDPALFFPNLSGRDTADGAPPKAARPGLTICRRCPVSIQCLQYALDHHPQHGIWGGTTELQRDRMHGRGQQAEVLPSQQERAQARRARVAELHERGVAPGVIAEELGVTPDLVHKDISRMGLAVPKARIDPVKVVELAAGGLPASRIALRLGFHPKTIYRVLQRNSAARGVA